MRITGPERIDVEPAAPRVARVNRQLYRLATGPYVHEDAFDALLMKLVVITKTYQIL